MSLNNIYYGHGKLLLTGEYFVLDGASALAIPCDYGQSLKVKYRSSYSPKLYWKSYDVNGNLWMDAIFEFWHFDLISKGNCEYAKLISSILKKVRILNSHFLREEQDVLVETKLEFPLNWGLGASSTLISNIAQWAYVSPFELLNFTLGGSGYDIACALSDTPIIFQNLNFKPNWYKTHFFPVFHNDLYFLYSGKKMKSSKAISYFKEKKYDKSSIIDEVNYLTMAFKDCKDLDTFEEIIITHENLVSSVLNLKRVKNNMFPDYWGEIKSLGAWGGDFLLVTSKRSFEETKKYFSDKGLNDLFSFKSFILKEEEQKLSRATVYV